MGAAVIVFLGGLAGLALEVELYSQLLFVFFGFLDVWEIGACSPLL